MGKKDICFLLMCIKYAKDKEALSRLRELTGTAVVSEDTCETIAEYLGEPELLKKGTRVIRMAGEQASTEEIARELAISKEEVERILE